MTSRQKGNRTQLKAIKYFEKKGFLVDKVEKTGKFHKQKDLFGLFDLIAIDQLGPIFIQVKTNSTDGMVNKLKKFSKRYTIDCRLMVWYDRKGWVIHDISDVSYSKTDLRGKK